MPAQPREQSILASRFGQFYRTEADFRSMSWKGFGAKGPCQQLRSETDAEHGKTATSNRPQHVGILCVEMGVGLHHKRPRERPSPPSRPYNLPWESHLNYRAVEYRLRTRAFPPLGQSFPVLPTRHAVKQPSAFSSLSFGHPSLRPRRLESKCGIVFRIQLFFPRMPRGGCFVNLKHSGATVCVTGVLNSSDKWTIAPSLLLRRS